jgi:hypothetical protein
MFEPCLAEPISPIRIDVGMRTGPWPIVGTLNVAVFHRVVVNVIQRTIVMTFITNVTIAESVPHFAPPSEAIFQILRSGSGSMEMFECDRDVLQRLNVYQEMIVVGQDSPTPDLGLDVG